MTRARPLADWETFPHFALQITERCNLECPHCNRWSEGRDMPADEVLRYAERMHEVGYSWVALGGGEPTLHPQLEAIIDGLHGQGLKVSMATNGTNPDVLARAPIDGLSVSASLPGWSGVAGLRPDLAVGANVIVTRDAGEVALETAAEAAKRGFARVVFLPLQQASAHHRAPLDDGYPRAADLDLILLAEPWLEELGLQISFGCAALRTMGLLDECPQEFRTVDLEGRMSSCAFAACPHRPDWAGTTAGC
jgi:hypothetical protein